MEKNSEKDGETERIERKRERESRATEREGGRERTSARATVAPSSTPFEKKEWGQTRTNSKYATAGIGVGQEKEEERNG